jgi:hypothetical protein
VFPVFPYRQRLLTGSWMNRPWETSFQVNTSEFKMFHSSWQSLRMIFSYAATVCHWQFNKICLRSQYHSCAQNLPWLWWLSWLTSPWPAWRNNVAVLHWMHVIDRFMLCYVIVMLLIGHCHAVLHMAFSFELKGPVPCGGLPGDPSRHWRSPAGFRNIAGQGNL